jgi:uncharacterized protein
MSGPPSTPRDSSPRGQAHADQARARLAVPWTLRQTLVGVGLTVVPLFVLLAASQVAPHHPTSNAPLPVAVDRAQALVILISSTLVESVFLVAPLYYALRRREAGASRWSGLQALGLRGFAPGQAVSLFVIGIALVYGFGLLYEQLGMRTNTDVLRQQALQAPDSTVAALLVAVLVAPVCEEVFFRGFAFPGFATSMPVWAALIASALVFGVAHADLGSLAPLVVIGLVAGLMRWRTGSLWPGIAFHALNNAVAAVYVLNVVHLR